MFALANDGNPNTTDRVAGCRLQKLPAGESDEEG
jgi:hypothetical protein